MRRSWTRRDARRKTPSGRSLSAASPSAPTTRRATIGLRRCASRAAGGHRARVVLSLRPHGRHAGHSPGTARARYGPSRRTWRFVLAAGAGEPLAFRSVPRRRWTARWWLGATNCSPASRARRSIWRRPSGRCESRVRHCAGGCGIRMAPHLGGATRVFVVPDSALNLVPIAALPAASGGYLLEHGPVDPLSVGRARPGRRRRRHVRGRPRQPAGGGRTGVLRLERASRRCAARRTQSLRHAWRRASRVDSAPASRPCGSIRCRRRGPKRKKWPRCGGRRAPAAREPARTLVGSVASEAAFKQLAPGRRVLHLATHGFFLGDECDRAAGHARRRRLIATSAVAAATPRPRRPAPRRALRKTRCCSRAWRSPAPTAAPPPAPTKTTAS